MSILDKIWDFFSDPAPPKPDHEKPLPGCVDDGSNGQYDADREDDFQEKPADSEDRVQQLESQIKELRSENLKHKADMEILIQKLEEAKKLESSFPELLKRLHKILGKSLQEENIDYIAELISLLSANGLVVDKDYDPGQEGFICIKDNYVTTPTVSLPVIIRGDDIILEGIVKVPMSFAGAEPPVEQMKPSDHDGDNSADSGAVAVTPAAEDSASDDDDDFRVNLK